MVARAKGLGFIAGAAVAVAGLTLVNAWRSVSDDDLLATVLTDHCIPYVRTGTTPFAGMGRPVGVYDQATLSDNLANGGTAILFDNRFVAQWGEGEDANSPVRVCIVNATFPRPDSKGFEVQLVGAPDWFADILPSDLNLRPDPVMLGPPPVTATWQQADADENTGLRLQLTGEILAVSNILVLDDIPPE